MKNAMIDLTDEQLRIVRAIVAKWAPAAEVRAFGSRVNGTARKHSDLDLAIVGDGRIDTSTLNRLREAFEDSELPFRVDVLDWNAVSESFRNVIDNAYIVLQPALKP